MNYPLISEYAEAIRAAENNLNTLSKLRPILDNNGNPVMANGDFAVVFKMEDTETGKLYAVKCFTREQEKREERYKEIIKELEKVRHYGYIVSTQYLDKELFVATTQSEETKFPVVVMDWVEGVYLDGYLKSIEGNKFKRELLAKEFQKLVCWLLPQPFAHGDLKPDNIIVKEDGRIVLVDYDEMFVPALYGKSALEISTPTFQYKGRTLSDFNEYIDDYAAVLLLLILKTNAISAVNFNDCLLDNGIDFIKKFEAYLTEKSIAPLLSAYIMVSTFGRIDRQQVYCLLADNTDFDYKKETELIAAARKGDTMAMINLGNLYTKGVYAPKNVSKAIHWYSLAHLLGRTATCNLCKCFYDDNLAAMFEKNKISFAYCRKGENYFISASKGAKDDFPKAAHWWKKAAEMGNPGAQSWLASLYKEGHGVKKDPDKAEYWLKKAADTGDSIAQLHLGDNYADDKGTEKDFSKAIYWWKKAAANGECSAQYHLAVCYEKGNGVKKDFSKSAYWLQKAAEIGYSNVPPFKLGIYYDLGLGVEKDCKKALFWYKKAAEKGNSDAQYRLGCYYDNGKKVEQDFNEAVYWFQKAAEKGHVEAQFHLGWHYAYGKGVETDMSKAVYWYQKAANAGNTAAQTHLGFHYYYGEGIEKNMSQAVYWLQKAAEAGDILAKQTLKDLQSSHEQ